MKTKIIKSQKPISLDVHLKYRCPNDACGYTHWLSLLETQTKNFKVVCDCGTIFKPKRINRVKILFKQTQKTDTNTKNIEQHIENTVDEPNETLLNKAVPCLVDLGFSKDEAIDALISSFKKNPTENIALWIKNTLLEIKKHGEQP